jgi:hypothetical protein
MPSTRRTFFRHVGNVALAALAPWIAARAGTPSDLRVGRIIGAQYLDADNRLWLFAEDGDEAATAPLVADDLIVLTRAVSALSGETSFMFTLEPIGDRMVPFFLPANIGPILAGSRAAMTVTYCDVLLKGTAMALPFATSLGLRPSEIDLLAADISRRAGRGERVEPAPRSVHRLFFTMAGVSTTSPDWLRITYANPTVIVILAPPAGNEDPLFAERQFAAVMEARFRELLRRRGFAGDQCRRLFNLFLCVKAVAWMKDIRVPIDLERLAAYEIATNSFPRIPVRRVSRTVVSPSGRSHVVQLEGGVRFDLLDLDGPGISTNVTRTAAPNAAVPARVHRVAAPLGNSGARTDVVRSPPPLSCEPVTLDGRRALRIDVSSLFGLSVKQRRTL